MSETGLRLISEEPVLARMLSSRVGLLSEAPAIDLARKAVLGLMEDVGRIVRSREFISSNVANLVAIIVSELVRRRIFEVI